MGAAVRAAGPLPDPEFWRARRVLVTGHSGFKGAWLTCWLRLLGAEVLGVSLPGPVSEPNLWDLVGLTAVSECRDDLVGSGPWPDAVRAFDAQVVVHLAAQPLVSRGWAQPRLTHEVNVLGTARVLELINELPSVQAMLIVTTDKVYDASAPAPYAEDSPLGGSDPYSASKAAAELVARSWPSDVPIATARAGNVIGGGDWAAHRLLPDLVKAWGTGRGLPLRHPDAIRPWQHVLEPLRGYLLYAEVLAAGTPVPRALNFGPTAAQAVPVRQVVEHAAVEWARLEGRVPDPAWTADTSCAFQETHVLTLNSELAQDALGWHGVMTWEEAVRLTLQWHAAVTRGQSAGDVVHQQLAAYAAEIEAAR